MGIVLIRHSQCAMQIPRYSSVACARSSVRVKRPIRVSAGSPNPSHRPPLGWSDLRRLDQDSESDYHNPGLPNGAPPIKHDLVSSISSISSWTIDSFKSVTVENETSNLENRTMRGEFQQDTYVGQNQDLPWRFESKRKTTPKCKETNIKAFISHLYIPMEGNRHWMVKC
jgi:hypothetical protein